MSDWKIEGSNGSLCDEGGGGPVVIISYQINTEHPPLPGFYRLLLIKLFQVKTWGSSSSLSTDDLDPASTIS